jgi:catechol 2,3-dioxygenase-like lactoylglutathione lyase family enzyme
MPVQLNHTVVPARDADTTAQFWSDVLGLPAPARFGPFVQIPTANGVDLDFADSNEEFSRTHYAFLVTEEEFDAIYRRIQERDLAHWADPQQHRPQEINHHNGGRGVYFCDPDGHYLEALTRPYAGG